MAHPRPIPQNQDSANGDPLSFEILLEWLARNGNDGYHCWVGLLERKKDLCAKILAEMRLHDICFSTDKCICLKMFMLINSYHNACEHLSLHGGMLSDPHPRWGTVQGLMNCLCLHWTQINAIMGPTMDNPMAEEE
ncbi:hypothetical protein MJO28_005527 [Puccinia striiformis f. sp. tritici]|uniref:Uncharacterized protein n=1 Tax=Puccinia striiformis f. sp. tritici TaxID=168172 RepID=A0ACC0EKA3_9BASI|nr:hypothetical protein MJO28_005527 [Puccinia striiformis f. sp. tritici]KAI7960497.1 hypothetical protein MJO29_005565 [Puccinia striiformis f. sp. tritici]KAI9611965.1 hypothetical protein H4Q26_008055 [Puccinia striiformis f. sp. tritici PST-130]KAI9621467.1 hypothetical protein KEM48_007702 [Puccinia striiformis f. sp. tritici PST-130]